MQDKLVKTLYILNNWNKQSYLDMMQKMDPKTRCKICGLWGCIHKKSESVIMSTSTALTGPIRHKEQNSDFVKCNICRTQIHINYIQNHILTHERPKGTTYTNPCGPSSVTPIRPAPPIPERNEPVVNSNGIPKLSGPKLKAIDSYKFHQIERVACIAGSTSNDLRYSDLIITFWLKNKPSTYSTTIQNQDNNRLVIHLVYDAKSDYWTISSKLLKRASYSSVDNEEAVPDIICYQNELKTEIKRIILFFCISPKSTYKAFVRSWKQEFICDSDEDGLLLIAQSKNCFDAAERLKTKSFSYHGHGYEGSYD